jgi:gluconolactonase
MRSGWLICGVAATAACGGSDPGPDAPLDAAPFVDAEAPRMNPLDGVGEVELVDDGYQFTEGPQWRDAEGDLVFSDIDGNTIYRYVPGGGAPTPLVAPSDRSNGLAVDGAGALLAAHHASRDVTRRAGAGVAVVVDAYQGLALNSPNDLVVAGDGTIYFTDPPYGITEDQRELNFVGVFRIPPGADQPIAEYMGPVTERPNGIAIDPSGARVLVPDTADGNVYAFPIEADGSLGARSVLADTTGTPDGMAVDAGGNLFVTSAAGVEVFDPDGTRWGVITVPQQPANCAFGDADHRTLYITARTAVYRVRLAVYDGLPRN